MIPKKIHYCWFGGNPLPRDVEACIASWKKHCPDYEIVRWDESNYDVTKHPFMKAAYEAKCWAFVSDYARLDVIYQNGGIYLDTDVELLKSLDPVLENACWFAMQQEKSVINTGLGFGAKQMHPAVQAMLAQYDQNTFCMERREDIACPYLNTRALAELGFVQEDREQEVAGARIYPARFFDPLATGDSKDLTCDETMSIHHYSATWTTGKQRLKRKIARLIGEKWIVRLKGVLRWKKS